MISTSLGQESFALCFMSLYIKHWICSSMSQFTVYGNLNRICILLLCENCIDLNYIELVHSAFQVYCILLWIPLVAQLVKNPPVLHETQVRFLGWKDPLEMGQATHPNLFGLPCWLSQQSACNVGDLDSIPGLGRSPGGGHGYPLQSTCLENPHEQRSLAVSTGFSQRVGHD